MNFWDKIMAFFANKKRGVKMLPEPQVKHKTSEEWRKEERIAQNNFSAPKISSLDNAIEQYMDAYFQKWQEERKMGKPFTAYQVLSELNTNKEKQGNNRIIQDELIDSLFQSRKIEVHTQFDQNNRSAFFHILHGNYETDENRMIRIYVNTQRENVARFSKTNY